MLLDELKPAPRLKLRLTGDPTVDHLLLLLTALLLAFGLVLPDRFLSLGTLQSIAFQMPELGILSLAMLAVMLTGGINLSIIATANITALAIAWTLAHAVPAGDGGVLIGLAVLAGLLLATAIGAVNGWIIAYLGVSPILATLGTMTALKGLAVGMTHGNVLSGFPDAIRFLGNGVVLGVPVPLALFAACAAPVAVLLRRTPFGVSLRMIGSNERATRFSGIDTRRMLLGAYALSGLLCGVAAVLMMARFNSANAAYGESYLLVTILAAVLGGVDPAGGFGKVAGLTLALVVLQVISSALNLMGLSAFLTLAIWGVILVAVMAVGFLRRRAG